MHFVKTKTEELIKKITSAERLYLIIPFIPAQHTKIKKFNEFTSDG